MKLSKKNCADRRMSLSKKRTQATFTTLDKEMLSLGAPLILQVQSQCHDIGKYVE
jgi:hypothetical protein